MSRALVASSASGLSLLFHLVRYLSVSTPSALAPEPAFPLPELLTCPAGSSEEQEGLHYPSVLVGICIGFLIIPLAEAVLSARLIAFRAALRRLGYQERVPLYRLL